MEVTIKLKEINANHNNVVSENLSTLHRKFTGKIFYYLNLYDVKSDLIVNGMIGMALQSNISFITNPLTTTTTTTTISNISVDKYIIGKIFDRNIYIDPIKKWNDNTIEFDIDKLTLRSNKINKILKNNKYIDYLEKIVIEQEIVDLLM